MYATYPSLRDRVVLISGGATGIGASLVEAFAAQGSQVAFLDLQSDPAQALAERCASAGAPRPLFLPCDLTDISAAQAAIRSVLDRHRTIDVLVNNAGNDTRHAFADVTPSDFDRILAVNLRHQFFLTQAVAPAMRSARRGSIVNMSSISWVIPSTGLPVYVTAKAAIVGLTRTLARELGQDNIRVNAVLPGAILTERQRRLWLTPEYEAEVLAAQSLKRLIQPDEVARLVLFLAADDSSAITGQSHIIDAGWV